MKKIREDDTAQRTKLLLKLGQMKNKQHRFPHIGRPIHLHAYAKF